jgi:hypothetical protein
MGERRTFYQPVFFNEGVTFGTSTGAISYADNVKFQLGTDGDVALVERSTVLNANTALAGVIVGTPVTPAVAANSLIVGNITADGDILLVTQTGGNSHANYWYDASADILRLYSGAGLETLKLDNRLVTLTGGLVFSGNARFGFGAPEQVTIASGVATITSRFVQLTSESGTTDTLDSFTFSGSAAGDIVRFIPKSTDTITFDNSVTMLLGAGTRTLAPGGYIDLQLLGTTWQERGFLTASS